MNYDMKCGWKYTTLPQQELPYDSYALCKSGGQTNPAAVTYDDSAWEEICVPHDLTASAELGPFQNPYNGYIEPKNVWYRRTFLIGETECGKRIVLKFPGISGDCRVYLNGCLMGEYPASFCGFEIDISDVLRYGAEPNVLAVSCDNHRMQSWWYQGCGIYREVLLCITSAVSIEDDSIRIQTRQNIEAWDVEGEFRIQNREYTSIPLRARLRLLGPDGAMLEEQEISGIWEHDAAWKFHMQVKSPELWEIGKGNLYTCKIHLEREEEELDCLETQFGFRSISFDAEKGFFLNGEHVEIRGMCFREDEGNLGCCIGKETYERRIRNLLEMGANAYRCVHNAPAQELLELCDRYGLLVVEENRRFDTGEAAVRELRRMVKRDRNHPCVILWSLGEEEPWQSDGRGYRIAKTLRAMIQELDGTRPVTMAMNGGFEEAGAAKAVDVLGINYNHKSYDRIREANPGVPLLATEIFSLGDVMDEAGDSCSGETKAAETFAELQKRRFFCGSFTRAGQESRGEHRNLSFFTDCCPIDCIGNRKDVFYRYQSMWREIPVLHICGGWMGKEGETQKVVIYTNAECVKLYVNKILAAESAHIAANKVQFEIPYASGTLRAEGWMGDRMVVRDERETAGEAVSLKLAPDQTEIDADGRTTVSIQVTAEDENGTVLPLGSYLFEAETDGPGEILCCDNGDPYCSAFPDKNLSCLYHGRGKIVIRSTGEAGQIRVSVKSMGLKGDTCVIHAKPAEIQYLPAIESPFVNDWFVSHVWEEEPDIYAYVEDMHYIRWQKYLEPAFQQTKDMPFYFRRGYVIYCNERDMPDIAEGQTASIVFESITGKAKILVSTRDYKNEIGKQFYLEKENAESQKVRLELPGVTSGERMIFKLIIHENGWRSGITGAVWLEYS